jgi:hypothetical protein
MTRYRGTWGCYRIKPDGGIAAVDGDEKGPTTARVRCPCGHEHKHVRIQWRLAAPGDKPANAKVIHELDNT